jgi:putative nucleotidyltransferase with HDIG domain
MAMDISGRLFDPAMGEGDLEINRIRFVGFAPDRIMEDPNRIFRAARFLATIDGKFSNHTIDSLRQYSYLAASVAPERIREEILKAMKVSRPSLFFDALQEIGILKYIFPELHKTRDQDGGPYHMESVWHHSMITGNELKTDNPMLRLVGFLHDIGKIEPNYVDDVVHFYHHHDIGAEMIERNLKALRFKNSEVKFAKNLVAVHMRGGIKAGPKGIRKILKKFAELDVNWEDWVALKVADRRGNLKRKPFDEGQILKLKKKFRHELDPNVGQPDIDKRIVPAFRVGDLAISGTVIQELLGIGPSEVIGAILQFLLTKVIAQPELNTREQLEKLILGKKGKKNG